MANVIDVASTNDTAQGDRLEPAAPPRRSLRNVNWKKWRARLVVALMIAGAVYGGIRLADSRSTVIARYDLGDVTLTGQAIPIESQRAGQVTAVEVEAQQRITRGQRLGTVLTTRTGTDGEDVQEPVVLTAPVDGVVLDDPAPVGSTVQPGKPVVQIYDPAELTFTAAVPVEDLHRVSPGMVATLSAPGIDAPIEAAVQRVVPRVEGAADVAGGLRTGPQRLELVLVPVHGDALRLVPGLRFTGTVDTRSGGDSITGDALHVRY